jgi:hypothetical protein
MTNEKINIEHFLAVVDTNDQPFVQDLHKYLTDNGCKVTVEEKKSGFFASYKHVRLKKSIVNLLFRKAGLLVRIYGENANKYLDFLNTLPVEMVQSIEEATVCKKLIDPDSCSPTCPTGYDFTIGSKRYKVCRYSGFEFLVTNKNNLYIKSFVENEIKERMAV